ncbi:MAG: tail fiber domain-containing protein [Prevotella sp.]|nr:tail fiber domain-containing protein [Prevotella sp.]
MKKVFLSILLLGAVIAASAQFKVNSNGSALVGSTSYSFYTNTPAIKMEVHSPLAGTTDNIGFQSSAYMTGTSYSKLTIGVLGCAGNGYNGRNMGVMGYLSGSKNGAGIYGTIYSNLNINIPGTYAGYFYGDTKVTGTVYAGNVVNTSDIRLKESIESVSEKEGEVSFLDKIMSVDVLEYNLKDRTSELFPDSKDMDEKVTKFVAKEKAKRHFGVSAQELQQLFPNLVEEGQDGYLAVNYIELVPVLIRSIQELKQELDETKNSENGTRGTTDIKKDTFAKKCVLYQNSPNPFKENTVIRFKLADDVRDAAICIFDMTGKTIKKLPISSGMESVSVGGYEIGEGMFLYSLIVNGQEIDTKKMVISK